MENSIMTQEVEQALKVLKQNGFYVENLWHINDVKNHFPNLCDMDAYSILNEALTTDEYFDLCNNSIIDVGNSFVENSNQE